MIIYNVTIKIDHEVHDPWLEWMRCTHLPEVLATGCFTEHRILKLKLDEEDGVTYAIQYSCESMETLEHYQTVHGPGLRNKTDELFKDKYVGIRTILEVID